MMRILLFLATNLAVVLIASITLSLFGFDGFMAGTRLGNHLGAGAHLRQPFGEEKREQGPCKTKDRTENQQLIEVQINPVGRHEPVEAEKAQGDAGNQHDRQVSGQEQQDAHHGCRILLMLNMSRTAGYIRCGTGLFNRATISNCVLQLECRAVKGISDSGCRWKFPFGSLGAP